MSGELSKVEETGTEDAALTSTDGMTSTSTDGRTSTSIDITTATSIDITTSTSIDITTSTSIDITTLTSNDGTTSESIAHAIPASIDGDSCFRSRPLEIPESLICPQDIVDSAQKNTDVPSCHPDLDVDREITMKDFLGLEEFLELEDGEKLEDLDSSREVTMEDFLGLEEWLEDMDQNSKKKLDDDQHTSRGDLKLQRLASINTNLMRSIDNHPTSSIYTHPTSIDNANHLSIDTTHLISIDAHCWTIRQLSPYIGVLDDPLDAEASQRGLLFRDEVDKSPSEAASIDTDRIPSIDTNKPASIDTTASPSIGTTASPSIDTTASPSIDTTASPLIDTTASPSIDTTASPSIDTTTSSSIDTGRVSEHKKFDVCGNLRNVDTTTRSDKSGGLKRRNWKKRKRIMGSPQVSLTPHFLDCVRKSRVRSRCFSHPFAKLRALLLAEMIDKGEKTAREMLTADLGD
ncbi:hypothetical protein DY000_02040739 [Brassica cretica]|uniref:Uncharacterized protein n=1 Tax=Brassica cretica TaxID=69181 RepID=A0ABQ7B6S8_BRACR|nr:hypothetical protein DY000_02040739 [Brassica cretica]